VAGEAGYWWLERSNSWWLERLGTVLVAGEAKLLVAEKGQTPLSWRCWVLVAGKVQLLVAGDFESWWLYRSNFLCLERSDTDGWRGQIPGARRGWILYWWLERSNSLW
jgi:hypothetical protein